MNTIKHDPLVTTVDVDKRLSRSATIWWARQNNERTPTVNIQRKRRGLLRLKINDNNNNNNNRVKGKMIPL